MEMKDRYTYEDLHAIIARLRGPGGCPWDRQQTHESLRGAIIEEVYEFADALDMHDAAGMCEELGDVLMLVTLHCALAEEAGSFSNADVIDGICRKMIARHSHVFGEDTAATAEEALNTWDRNKYAEKAYTSVTDTLRGVPRAFPSLLRAQKVQKRASAPDTEPDIALQRLTAAVDALSSTDVTNSQVLEEKIGEVLWQTADFARRIKINADFALTNAIEKFINRFEVGEIDRKQYADSKTF